MKANSLGFIGGGRITKVFLQALANAETKFEKVVVFDTDADVLAKLKSQYPFVETGDLQLAASQATVFVALHPPVVMETLEKVADVVAPETVVVSLAPKITIEKIASKLKTQKIVRTIPNATSFINEGYNPVSFASSFEGKEKKQVLKLLKKLGKTFEAEESKLESYAIVSAMLPTYFWFQWQEMETIAMETGLSAKEARRAVSSTLKKALKLYYESGLTPDEVMDLIPVKPIGEHEPEIKNILNTKLIGLFGKIKP